MDEELEALEKSGATETAAKLREKWKAHATAHDTLKAEAAAHAKKLSQAEKDLAKYKADLEASGKGTDERLTKLQKERDDFKTAAEQRAAEFESFKLRTKLGDKLGIPDAKRRDRALDAFLQDYRPEGAGLDAKGELQGFDKALEIFKAAESFYFVESDAGHGGGRAGADKKPNVNGKGTGEANKVQGWAAKLFPQKNTNAKA